MQHDKALIDRPLRYERARKLTNGAGVEETLLRATSGRLALTVTLSRESVVGAPRVAVDVVTMVGILYYVFCSLTADHPTAVLRRADHGAMLDGAITIVPSDADIVVYAAGTIYDGEAR